MSMTVKDYRELYEGLTQEDPAFRNRLYALADTDLTGPILSELELAENRLNHAMLGIHPIYRREVELSGIVDYEYQTFRLFAPEGETATSFTDLDPAYVAFLESQKRIYNVKETLPLSSVAIKAGHQMLEADGVPVPDTSDVPMHVPKEPFAASRKVLEAAFAKNMTMLDHLQKEIEKSGLARVYGANRDDLISYCQSNSFDYSFNKSVNELSEAAEEAVNIGEV